MNHAIKLFRVKSKPLPKSIANLVLTSLGLGVIVLACRSQFNISLSHTHVSVIISALQINDPLQAISWRIRRAVIKHVLAQVFQALYGFPPKQEVTVWQRCFRWATAELTQVLTEGV